MSQKPVYQGTMASYQALPWNIKQYYSPPVETPEGYKYQSSKMVTSQPLPENPVTRTGKYKSPQEVLAITTHEEVTFVPKTYEVPTVLFGPKKEYYDPSTGVMQEELMTRQGEKILVTVNPNLEGPKTASPHEQAASSGLGLATVVATGAAIPVAGAGGVVAVGVAEGAKVGLTGEHLTPDEAIAAAGVGELAALTAMGVTQKYVKPRVERNIGYSYREAVENQQLWEPSALQRVGMKLTGAKTPRLAQELVGAKEAPPVNFRMLNQKTLGASEEAYFWDMPTPRSSEVYAARVAGSRAKTWAGEHLINRVSGGLSYSLVQVELERQVSPELPYIPNEPYITEALNVGVVPLGPAVFGGLLAVLQPQRLSQKQRVVQRQSLSQQLVSRQELISESRQDEIVNQILNQDQIQSQQVSLRQQEALTQSQMQTQVQKQKQSQMAVQDVLNFTPNFQVANIPSLPTDFGLTGFGRPAPRRRLIGKKKVWEFPVADPKKVMRELGL